MDIPIGAEVTCSDGTCGKSTYIVLDPVKDNVSHIVVEEENLPHIERLVPIAEIAESNQGEIRLKCSREDVSKMPPFVETDFIRSDDVEFSVPFEYPYPTPFLVWPYVEFPNGVSIVRLEHVPPSELAVRRGASVEATDGLVGDIEEFAINKENGHITHLILRKGPIWGEKEIAIPISSVDHINENTVYLKLNKMEVAALPFVRVHRRWHYNPRRKQHE